MKLISCWCGVVLNWNTFKETGFAANADDNPTIIYKCPACGTQGKEKIFDNVVLRTTKENISTDKKEEVK